MKNALLVILLTCFSLGAYGQEKQQTSKTNKKAPQKAAGTENNPVFIKQHKTPTEKADDEKAANDAKDNLQIQRDTLKVNEKMLKANQISAHYTRRGAWVAFFASIAAILALLIAGIQAIFFWRQLERMQESNETASSAAKTALLQSESIRLAERAYVKMNAAKNSVRMRLNEGFHFGLRTTNYGNTTAIVTQENATMLILKHMNDLPEQPIYVGVDSADSTDDTRSKSAGVLVRKESHISDRNFAISNPDIEEVRVGNKLLFIAGFTDYIDVFGSRHRAGYLWTYVYRAREDDDPESGDPEHSPLEFLSAYAMRDYHYDVERTPDMDNPGNDWDEKAKAAYRDKIQAKPKSWHWQLPFRSFRAYR